MAKKERADAMAVAQGLCEDVEKAKRLIMARQVFLDTVAVEKCGELLPAESVLRLKEQGRYVGRGGLKMEGALKSFQLNVEGLVCLDIGSSTGGFTDCLLQHGATRVHAIDAGTNQLAWKLRSDERVISREKFNARNLKESDLGELVDLIVIDVSFISLTKILTAAEGVLKPGGRIVALVKPQFELSSHEVGEGGIVRDPEMHQKALIKVQDFVEAQLERLSWVDTIDSPIKGTMGNLEMLGYLKKSIGCGSS